jgi:hypothetical protein
MTQSVSNTQRVLAFSAAHSNKLLLVGLVTLLAGVAMLSASQTYYNGIPRDRVTGGMFLGFIVGSVFTLACSAGLATATCERKRQGAWLVGLAFSVAMLFYGSLVCALQRSCTVLRPNDEGGIMLITDKAPFNALRGISSTIMIAGAGAMGLGFVGWLVSRKAAQHLKAPSAQTLGDGDAL